MFCISILSLLCALCILSRLIIPYSEFRAKTPYLCFICVQIDRTRMTREVLAEPTLRKYVEEQPSMLTEQMIARFTKDKNAGLLRADFDPQLVVPVIVTYMQGLWRMALVSYDRTCFERQNGLLLTSLGL
jgi:hypothetical protein